MYSISCVISSTYFRYFPMCQSNDYFCMYVVREGNFSHIKKYFISMGISAWISTKCFISYSFFKKMSIKVNFHASFSRTLLIDLNRAGRRSIVESTHFTAQRSNSDVYLAIWLSVGFCGILSFIVSLQSMTQRCKRFWVRSSSDWTNLKWVLKIFDLI